MLGNNYGLESIIKGYQDQLADLLERFDTETNSMMESNNEKLGHYREEERYWRTQRAYS